MKTYANPADAQADVLRELDAADLAIRDAAVAFEYLEQRLAKVLSRPGRGDVDSIPLCEDEPIHRSDLARRLAAQVAGAQRLATMARELASRVDL